MAQAPPETSLEKSAAPERASVFWSCTAKSALFKRALISAGLFDAVQSEKTTRPSRNGAHVEYQLSQYMERFSEPNGACNDPDDTKLCVPTDPEAKQRFETYFDAKYGREAENVIRAVRRPGALTFKDPRNPNRLPRTLPSVACHERRQQRSEEAAKLQREGRGLYDRTVRMGQMGIRHQTEWKPFLPTCRNWSNLPYDSLISVVNLLHPQKVGDLRSVCRTWQEYIDRDLRSLDIEAPLRRVRQPLWQRFTSLERLRICEDLNYRVVDFHFPVKTLRALDLRGCSSLYSFAFSKLMTSMKQNLTELSLADTDVADWKLCLLKDLVHLKHLTLDGLSLENETLVEIAHQHLGLTYLSFQRCQGITDEGISQLAGACANLRELDLSRNPALTFDETDRLSRFASLKILHMCYCTPTEYGFQNLATLPALTDLHLSFTGEHDKDGLSLSVCHLPKLSPQGLRQFGRVRQESGLRSIRIEAAESITFKQVVEGLLQILPLEDVTVVGGVVYSSCIWWTKYWNTLPMLRSLRLNTAENSTTQKDLCNLLRASSLTDLDLPHCYGMMPAFLYRLKQCMPHLRRLDVSYCPFVDNCALYCLCRHPKLEQLNISYCADITHNGWLHLSAMKRLKVLKMAGFFFAGEEACSTLSTCPVLEAIDLSDCMTLSISCLVKLAKMPTMKVLTLDARWESQRRSVVEKLYQQAAHLQFNIQFFSSKPVL